MMPENETRNKGRVLLFTGSGKGKTTAALGMVLRAAGHGMKCLVIQFVKADSTTGELAGCRALSGVEMIQAGRGFVPDSADPAFEEHCHAAREGFVLAENALRTNDCHLLVLDEICLAVAKGLLAEQDVIALVERADGETAVVMTGRGATAGLIAMADTVTEMHEVKHGFKDGWKAEKGIEH
ncbi:MAG: Corrinoid adenosyltransferase [Syntrophus sp. SKADARSKE-3]|nr:Corrinoid adenosyltransferase [Syntrophus sp. SKADARSKE-3]